MKKDERCTMENVAYWIALNHQDWLYTHHLVCIENELPIVRTNTCETCGQLSQGVVHNGKCMEYVLIPVDLREKKENTLCTYSVKAFLKEFLYDGLSANDMLLQFHRPDFPHSLIMQHKIEEKDFVLQMIRKVIDLNDVPCEEGLQMTIEIALRYKVIIPAKIDDELVLDVTYDPDSLLKFMPWQIRLLRKLVNKLNFEETSIGKWHGITRWTNEDIIGAASEQGVTMTDKQAEIWWEKNEAPFKNLMVEAGNRILADMDFS